MFVIDFGSAVCSSSAFSCVPFLSSLSSVHSEWKYCKFLELISIFIDSKNIKTYRNLQFNGNFTIIFSQMKFVSTLASIVLFDLLKCHSNIWHSPQKYNSEGHDGSHKQHQRFRTIHHGHLIQIIWVTWFGLWQILFDLKLFTKHHNNNKKAFISHIKVENNAIHTLAVVPVAESIQRSSCALKFYIVSGEAISAQWPPYGLSFLRSMNWKIGLC